jgi:hypothetical protein
MSHDAHRQSAASPLATARYIHNALGDLAKLAQQAQLEGTEVMLLAARIEALGAVRRLRAEPAAITPLPRRDASAGG